MREEKNVDGCKNGDKERKIVEEGKNSEREVRKQQKIAVEI